MFFYEWARLTKGHEWNAWGLGILAVGAVGVVAFGPEMRSKMTKTTAEVATETLQNESLQIQTQVWIVTRLIHSRHGLGTCIPDCPDGAQ